jgi:hypothetical protein
MTISKLRIDLSNGQLEIEGDKDLVRAVYKDFKDQLAEINRTPSRPHHKSETKANGPPAPTLATKSRRSVVGKKAGRKPLSKTGTGRRSRVDAVAMRKEISAARKKGISVAELAEKYGISKSYIYQQK